MTEKNFTQIKEQLKSVREHRGPSSPALLNEVKDQAKTQKAVLNALGQGPLTVPELAQTIGIGTRKLLWYIAALRKYGKVADGPKRGAYPSYIQHKDKP